PPSPSPTPTSSGSLFTSQRIVTASPLETYHYSDNKNSINLNEPNTIYVYQSPKTNEVSEQNTGRTMLPFFTTTTTGVDQPRVYNLGPNSSPVTQAPPPLPTKPMTTSRAISEVEYDVVHDFVQTVPVTST